MDGSVLLHRTIDTADEDVGGIKSDAASEQPETEHHHQGVAKVEKRGNEVFNLQLVCVCVCVCVCVHTGVTFGYTCIPVCASSLHPL